MPNTFPCIVSSVLRPSPDEAAEQFVLDVLERTVPIVLDLVEQRLCTAAEAYASIEAIRTAALDHAHRDCSPSLTRDAFTQQLHDRLYHSRWWSAFLERLHATAEPETIGQQIERHRRVLGWSVPELAKRVELNTTSVYEHVADKVPVRPDTRRTYERVLSEA